MNANELSSFEARLYKARPAAPPPDFEGRLFAARPVAHRQQCPQWPERHGPSWLQILRWLVPATALILAAGLLWLGRAHHPGRSQLPPSASSGAGLKADEIQIDHELVSAVDAIARLPDGEPVRFRYQEWMDEVILRDRTRGVVIHQRTPRVELVPVGFETY
jgi:hypothetical protein